MPGRTAVTCQPGAASPAREVTDSSRAQCVPFAAASGQQGEQRRPELCAQACAEALEPGSYRCQRAAGHADPSVIAVLAVFTGRCPGPQDRRIDGPGIRAALLAAGHTRRPAASCRQPAPITRARMSASPSAAGSSYRPMQGAISHQTMGLRLWSPSTGRSVMAIGPVSGSPRTGPGAAAGPGAP